MVRTKIGLILYLLIGFTKLHAQSSTNFVSDIYSQHQGTSQYTIDFSNSLINLPQKEDITGYSYSNFEGKNYFERLSYVRDSSVEHSISDTYTKFKESRFRFLIGGYLAFMNSTIQLGLRAVGVGIIIDTENALGLNTNQRILYTEFRASLGKQWRHNLELGFMFNRRSAFKIVTEDITIGDIFIPAYTSVETKFNFDLYQLEYLYSIVKEKRVEVQVGGGFFIAPIDFEVEMMAPGLEVERRTGADITAPLPVIGMHLQVALAPRLFLTQYMDLMYLKIGRFEGDIINFQINLEYQIIKNFGLGGGWHKFNLNVKSEDEKYPGLDFRGQIGFGYSGPFLYCIAYF